MRSSRPVKSSCPSSEPPATPFEPPAQYFGSPLLPQYPRPIEAGPADVSATLGKLLLPEGNEGAVGGLRDARIRHLWPV